MQTRKAQIALEFMILAGFFLLVFIIAVGYFASLQRSEITDREYLLGREITSLVADEVHAALLGGAGYEKTFELPRTIAGSDYALEVRRETTDSTAFAEISWTRGAVELEYAQPLATRDITLVELHPEDGPVTVKNNVGDGTIELRQ